MLLLCVNSKLQGEKLVRKMNGWNKKNGKDSLVKNALVSNKLTQAH